MKIIKADNYYLVSVEAISILASVQAVLVTTFYFPSMPFIARELTISNTSVQQAVSLFIIGQAIVPLLVGHLADYFGIRRTMIASMLLFSVSCALLSVVATPFALLVFRFLQGGFSQAGVVLSRAMVRGEMSYAKTVKMLSYIALVQSFLHILAPSLGGWLIAYTLSWYWSFYLVGMIGIFIAFLAYFWQEKKTSELPKDKYIGLSVLGKILSSKKFLLYSFIISTLHFSTIFFFCVSPFYFITFLEVSPELYGTYLGITSLGFMIGSLVLARIADKVANEQLLNINLYICILSGIILLLAFFFGRKELNIILIVISQFLHAFAKAIISPILQTKTLSIFTQHKSTCSSIFNFISTIIVPLGSLMSSVLDYKSALIFLGVMMVFISLIDMLLYYYVEKSSR